MSFIDTTYFINDISIAGATLTDTSFQSIIDRYEPNILVDLLGYDLYKALLADLDVDGDPQTQRFIDLVEGAEFSFELDGETVSTKWKGFVNDEKISLIAYYVYFTHRKETDSFYAGAGVQVEPLTENSVKSDNWAKLVDSWNKMINYYGLTPPVYKHQHREWYSYYGTDWTWRDTTQFSHYNDLDSCYNFLLANIDDYPEWVFKPKFRLNQFDI